MKKQLIYTCILTIMIATACMPQEQTIIRKTTYNIEDMCPNDNSTFCYYYVTTTTDLNHTNISDNTTWNETL